MVWKYDGKNLTVGKSWTDKNGFKHPYNWATSWTDDNKKEWGVTWEDDVDISYDSRFYWSKGIERKIADEDAKDKDNKQLYESDGKTKLINEGLKTIWIRKTKETANNMLAKTDWEVTRKSEKGTAIASATTTFRDKVRTACDSIEKSITDCKTLADFKKLFDTPVDKDGTPTGNPPIHDFPED